MNEKRRQADVEIAVLNSKMDHLANSLVSHMKHEEEERQLIWKKLDSLDDKFNKLDKRFLLFFSLIFASAGGPNIAELVTSLL